MITHKRTKYTETTRLIRDGEKGWGGVWRWGKREFIYLSLHCHHQNDSCIKMGSDESHFNVSLTVRDKVTRQCPQATREKRAEADSNRSPSAYRWAKPAHTIRASCAPVFIYSAPYGPCPYTRRLCIVRKGFVHMCTYICNAVYASLFPSSSPHPPLPPLPLPLQRA